MVKAENTVDMLPFVPTIMEVHISEQFVPPQFKMYDGSTDLEDQIKRFTNLMVFHTRNVVIWCRVFSLSLEGEAYEWFNSLPSNSIENFDSLKRMFRHQFVGSRAEDLTIFALVNLKHEKEESLRMFMDRYQKIIRRVKGLNLELALQYVLLALKQGMFGDSICRRAPETMEELRERVTEDIRVEEMRESCKKKG